MNKITETFLNKSVKKIESNVTDGNIPLNTELNLVEWNLVQSITVDSDSKLSPKALKLISELKELRLIDFNDLDCRYDLSEAEYSEFMNNDIVVILNENMKYSEFQMNVYKNPNLLIDIDLLIENKQKELEQLRIKRELNFGVEFI